MEGSSTTGAGTRIVRGWPGGNDEALEWGLIAQIRSKGRHSNAARRAWQQTTKYRGLKAAGEGRVVEAIRLLEQARVEGRWPDAEVEQHLCELRIIRRLEKRLEVRPNDAAALLELGKAYFGQERADAALATFRRAVAVAPQNAEAHAMVALELHFRGDCDGAAREYEEALRLQPSQPLAVAQYAALLRGLPPGHSSSPDVHSDRVDPAQGIVRAALDAIISRPDPATKAHGSAAPRE